MKNKKIGKENLKRIATLSLSMMMLTGMVMPVSDSIYKKSIVTEAEVKYDGEFYYGGKTFKYLDDGLDLTLVSVSGSGDLDIPSSVKIHGERRDIKYLGNSFGTSGSFRSVYIPDTVTEIGDEVFFLATIKNMRISSNLEKIGKNFCSGAKVDDVYCLSKKIKSIGLGAFDDRYSDKTYNIGKVKLGDWLVKYRMDNNILDLTSSYFDGIKHICNNSIIGSEIEILKIKDDSFDYLNNKDAFEDYSCIKTIKNVYFNGAKVTCNNSKDELPILIKLNYDLFEGTRFEDYYAKTKAKAILKSLGIKYYGSNASSVKGTLSAEEEFEIVKKVHNYLVQNYIYDVDRAKGSYYRIFNLNTYTVCRYDAEMNAFLLESAGIEAEAVQTGKVTEISKEEFDKYEPEEVPNKAYVNSKIMSNDRKKYYKIEYSGRHEWNAVKIGGEWYHIDLTQARTIANRSEFLVSDDYFEGRVTLNPELSMVGNRGMHGYPYFAQFSEDGPFDWQMSNHAFKSTNCKKTIGNVNDDLYINQTDVDMIQAYTLLSTKYRNILANVAAGKYKATTAEKKVINSNAELINSSGKCVFNISVADTNFDGNIDVSDVLEMQDRLRHIKTRQWDDLK